MNNSRSVLAALLAPAFFMAWVVAPPAAAQEKKVAAAPERATKVLIDNDRVRVTESVFKPGESNPMAHRDYRITRVLMGNAPVVQTYADGRTEKLEYKEGAIFVSEAGPSSTRNVGNYEVGIYTVALKPQK
jgi:hypothetical protein